MKIQINFNNTILEINNKLLHKKIQLFLYLYKFVFNNNQNNFYCNEIEFTRKYLLMKEICQNFLPICPWEKIVTSRLPGIQPLEHLYQLYIVDDAFNAQMSYRDYLIKEKRSEIFSLSKKALPAAEELLESILAILKNKSKYKIYPDRVQRPDKKIIFLNEDNPIITAGRLIQEDLLILHWDNSHQEHILEGGVLCFPALWTLKEKINKPLSRIHKPVLPYNDKITRSVQRMFNHLKVDKPIWRANWYLYKDPELFSPLSEKFSHTTKKDYFEGDFWVRVERQTLKRLPDSNAIIFGIHTYVVNRNNLTLKQITSLKNYSLNK